MARTKIEWANYTVNCFWGCNKGCTYCQARNMARRFGRKIGTDRRYSEETIKDMVAFKPVFLADQLSWIKLIKKPSRIFMSFMGEPFSEEFEEYLPIAFKTMRAFPEHTFIMLTKRPENLPKHSPFPENCWVGFSATDTKSYQNGLLTLVKYVQASVKFISFEPLKGRIGVPCELPDTPAWLGLGDISWVVVGAQTPYSRKNSPQVEWVKEIVEAADKQGKVVFLKDNLRGVLPHYPPFYGWQTVTNTAAYYDIRQEFPTVGVKV